MITTKQLRFRIKELDKFLLKKYKEQTEEKKRDYQKYEQERMRRIKKVIKNLEPLIEDSTKKIKIYRGRGRKSSLTIKQKLRLFLIKRLCQKSNRNMAYMLDLFSMMTGIDISYKTVERLYSDEEVEIALHNLFILLLEKQKVKNIDASGDATGYGLTITKHYASVIQKRKDKAKYQKEKKKHFVYKFALMDLKTKMYVCYGSSLISEKKAFDQAMQMLKELNIKIRSIRLDRYYSFPCYVNLFPNSKFYMIPRKNSKMGHGINWFNAIKSFMDDTISYLKDYFKRNNSESGFGADKKLLGWRIAQKREDRIDCALFCGVIWHNLFNLYRD